MARRRSIEFWRIPTNGGVPEEILHGRGVTGNFTWLNSDSGIITDSLTLHSPLLTLDLGSGASRALTTGISHDLTPSISQDGHTLAFASGEFGFDIIEVPLNGSAPRDVIATAQSELAPGWVPDGIRFAYVTYRSGSPEIWLRNRADGSERLIVGAKELPSVDLLYDCLISPDGSRLAYRAHRGGDIAIWISPLSGEAPLRLWDDSAKAPQRGPSWSPDGNSIAYYADLGGRPAVMKARVGGSAARIACIYRKSYATALVAARRLDRISRRRHASHRQP
jgi:TolB protein